MNRLTFLEHLNLGSGALEEGDGAALGGAVRAVELPVGNHPAFIAVLHVRGRLMGVAVNDQINACGFDGFGNR